MLVAHFLGTMRPDHDGVTRVMYRMRDEFASTSVRNIFVSPILPSFIPSDMRAVSSLPFPFSTDYRLALANSQTIKNALQNQKPDIIHIHTPCPLGRAASRYARENEIPLVVTYHTHFPTYMKYYKVEFIEGVIWKYLHTLYDHAAAIIVPSKATIAELAEKGFENLCHIPHGVDTARFSPSNRNQKWRESVGGEDKVIVTFVGRLVWEKNLRAVAEAAKLMTTKQNVQFVVVGDGPARSDFEKLLPKAHFTGFLKDEELAMAYASSDVFFFPSVTETFGNVTIEAMASGLPAVCANRGGAFDIVQHGENGFLVEGSNAKEFANCLDRLVLDSDLRKSMSEKAYEASKKYQWCATAQKYEDLYRNILNTDTSVPNQFRHQQDHHKNENRSNDLSSLS